MFADYENAHLMGVNPIMHEPQQNRRYPRGNMEDDGNEEIAEDPENPDVAPARASARDRVANGEVPIDLLER